MNYVEDELLFLVGPGLLCSNYTYYAFNQCSKNCPLCNELLFSYLNLMACCNTDNKEDGAFLEVESVVMALLLSPSRASLIDIEPVEIRI